MRPAILLVLPVLLTLTTACESDAAKLHRLETDAATTRLALVAAQCPDSVTPSVTLTTPDTIPLASTPTARDTTRCRPVSSDSLSALRDRATLAQRDLDTFLHGR